MAKKNLAMVPAWLALFLSIAPLSGEEMITLDESKIRYVIKGSAIQAYTKEGNHPFSGIVFTRFPGGCTSKELQFQNAKPHGSWKYWYPNGQVQSVTTFNNGEIEGEDKLWYENGKIKQQAHYRKGALHGPMKSFWRNGALENETIWENGRFLQ